MECKEGFGACANYDIKCHLCLDGSQFKELVIKQKKGLKHRNVNKQSKRMGSVFEMSNHKNNEEIVKSSMTPNSGACKIKGDEQITGIIRVMEELKTQEVERARGHSQFTIKKEWLDKLEREAKNENMEFWYLKFAFKNTDTKSYTVIDTELMMDLIATIINDRNIANKAEDKINVYKTRVDYIESKLGNLNSKIDLLKKENAHYKALLKVKGDI